jgi:ATP-dependent DNA helicase Rep
MAMDDEEAEADQIAIISAHRFERRAKFADYAILYRGNHQARILEKSLRRERIPYVMSGGQSYFDRAEIKDIIAYLRLIANQDDDPAFIRAVTTPPRRRPGHAGSAGHAGRAVAVLAVRSRLQGRPGRQADRPPAAAAAQVLRLHQCAGIARHPPRPPAAATTRPRAGRLLEAINYENYLYDMFDERAAQSKWQNVLDFINWLKERAAAARTATARKRTCWR